MITFKDIMPWIISLVSIGFAIWTQAKKDTSVIATISTKLENIQKSVDTLTQENKDWRAIVYNLQSDVAVLKADIDRINKELANVTEKLIH